MAKPKKAPKTKTVMVKVPDKRRAYVVVIADDGTHRLGIAVEGEPGYYSIKDSSDLGGPCKDRKEAQALAQICNERLGLTKDEADKIVISSMTADVKCGPKCKDR